MDDRARICEAVEDLLQAAFDDWAMMVGVEAKVVKSLAKVLPTQPETLERVVGPGMVMKTKVEGESEGEVFFAFPPSLFGPAVFEAMMIPINEDLEFNQGDEGHIGALKELMNLFCGSATRSVQSGFGEDLRVSQSVDDIKMFFPDSDLKAVSPSEGSILCVQTQVEYRDGHHRIVSMLPPQVSDRFAGQS